MAGEFALDDAAEAQLASIVHSAAYGLPRGVVRELVRLSQGGSEWALRALLALAYEGVRWATIHRGSPIEESETQAISLVSALLSASQEDDADAGFRTLLYMAEYGALNRLGESLTTLARDRARNEGLWF
jgi:hypothetical protein